MHPITVSRVLVIIALIIFTLAAFHVNPAGLDMIAMGLAFFVASFLVP